jgi:hypothetical protein
MITIVVIIIIIHPLALHGLMLGLGDKGKATKQKARMECWSVRKGKSKIFATTWDASKQFQAPK